MVIERDLVSRITRHMSSNDEKWPFLLCQLQDIIARIGADCSGTPLRKKSILTVFDSYDDK
jgi:hypothetical protein